MIRYGGPSLIRILMMLHIFISVDIHIFLERNILGRGQIPQHGRFRELITMRRNPKGGCVC